MHNRLAFSTYSITDSNLYGGVSYEAEINPDVDITVGNVASAKIEFTTDTQPSSTTFTYSVQFLDDSSYTTVGIFNISNIKKISNSKYKITAYDNVNKFVKDIKENITNSNTEITLGTFFNNLCSWVGVIPQSTTFTNSTIRLTPNLCFGGNHINAREILSYICSVAGGFAVALPNGKIAIKHFEDNTVTINQSKYKKMIYADYQAPAINCIKVTMSDMSGEIGVVYPENVQNPSALMIPYNAIFYNIQLSRSQRDTVLGNILNIVGDYLYTPCQLELFSTNGAQLGDKIRVQIPNTSSYINSYVFTTRWDSSGVAIESTGAITRDTVDISANSEVQQMVGKYHIIENSVNEHKQVLGDLLTGDEKQFRIDAANGVTITDNVTGNLVKIDGNAVNASRINCNDLNMVGRIAFGDLTNDVQQRIDDAGVPSYIKETYIDSVRVMSPSIEGNNVNVRNGYFQIQGQASGEVQPTTYAHLGLAAEVDAAGVERNGGVFRTPNGEAYIFVNDYGVRLQMGDYAILLEEDGPYVIDNGHKIRLGEARFS